MKNPKMNKGLGTAHQDERFNRIVISSRIRLARNLKDVPFPGWAKKTERIKIMETIRPVVSGLPEMKSPALNESMDNFSALEKQVLVERHLISREHAAKNVGSGLVVDKGENLSLMINEEDHLRMQAISHGFNLDTAWKLIDKVDTELEGSLDFAFSQKIGYLTACPTNVGTGMRASAMLHLPALVICEQINQIIQAVNKLGLAVRGLYGEGTEASGNLFQISNQTTLGESEKDILERLTKVIVQIIGHEENARANLLEKRSVTVYDQMGRAFGVLTNAYSMNSKEAMNLLSIMRLGVDLGMFAEELRTAVDELFIETQPAHMQKGIARKLSAEERDLLRAEIIRERLSGLNKPKIRKSKPLDSTEEKE